MEIPKDACTNAERVKTELRLVYMSCVRFHLLGGKMPAKRATSSENMLQSGSRPVLFGSSFQSPTRLTDIISGDIEGHHGSSVVSMVPRQKSTRSLWSRAAKIGKLLGSRLAEDAGVAGNSRGADGFMNQ